MIRLLRSWWKDDLVRRWLFIGGFIYAFFFAQGLPLWDDDFTSWFWKIKDKSIFSVLLEWISPISTQPQYWGFNERPVQVLIYKIFYLISGYESWSFFLYKSLVYGGLAAMIYQWGLRLVPSTRYGRVAALLASVFFILTPGPMAAHVMHQDVAPTAELIFLIVTYLMWDAVEETPVEWAGLPNLKDPAQKSWVLRWLGLSFLTYLGYKAKADLKMIPFILAAYVLLVRRRQAGFFAVPFAAMLLLAIPWGPGIFSKLPPFVPGSGGSEIGWMWQPAKLQAFREFIWASGSYDFVESMRASTISLAGVLGPFLLVGILVFLGWKTEGAVDRVPWRRLTEKGDRARAFVLLWFFVILAATAALPEINYIFRIRYGILTMVPTAILLAWVFGLFAASLERLPKWVVGVALALLTIQSAINLNRSIVYRHDMGQVMIAVDQVYERFAKEAPNKKLTLLPDFRPYDYRPDAPKAFQEKEWLGGTDDLVKKHKPFETYVISWKPSLWDQLEMVHHAPGCRESALFDRIFRCAPGTGAYLMRYIGEDPLYKEAERLRGIGDLANAKRLIEQYLVRYPKSLGGQFVMGLIAYNLKDWTASQAAYQTLEGYFPEHMGIMYNHALALEELKEYQHAINRLKFIANKEPRNYPVLIHLYWSYAKAGQDKNAKETLVAMKRTFPEDPEVTRLLAGGK